MSKTVQRQPDTVSTELTAIDQKAELTIKAVDSLIFRGPIKGMLEGIAGMVGLKSLSIGLILPQRNKGNMRPFLRSLSKTINLVLDDQVSFAEYVPLLAEEIKVIQKIAEEEG